MKIAIYVDDVNQFIDNSMQRHIVSCLSKELSTDNEVVIIDPLKIGKESAKSRLIDQNYDILLTYNKTGTDLTLPNTNLNLIKSLEKPSVAWLVEHPVTFYDQYIESDSPGKHYILPNLSQKLFIKDIGLRGTGSELLFTSTVKKNKLESSKREFDICIAAQWRGTADINEFWKGSNKAQHEFFDRVNLLQHLSESGDIYASFIAAAEFYNIDLQNKKDYCIYYKALYWHARKTERIKMVQDLVGSGLKILLIGSDEWKQVLPRHDNVTFLPLCSPLELISNYSNSRAVAATNCFNGANERTFDAISCGAISISENSPTLSRHFKDQESIFFYDRLCAKDKVDLIVDILNDYKMMEMINENSHEIFMGSHTWRHRAKSLMKIINDKIDSQIINY